MVRVLKGNVNDLPKGMEPMEYARVVFAVMDEQGVDQVEAKQIVRDRQNDYNDEEES